MVDVSDKRITPRRARAEGWISMPSVVIDQLERLKKGNAFEVARLAAIQAAKKTGDLIPLCHPLALSWIGVEFETLEDRVRVEVQVKCEGKTGVEMEALTAVSTALLTLYDMVKSSGKGMEIGEIRLLEKTGGRSGHWRR